MRREKLCMFVRWCQSNAIVVQHEHSYHNTARIEDVGNFETHAYTESLFRDFNARCYHLPLDPDFDSTLYVPYTSTTIEHICCAHSCDKSNENRGWFEVGSILVQENSLNHILKCHEELKTLKDEDELTFEYMWLFQKLEEAVVLKKFEHDLKSSYEVECILKWLTIPSLINFLKYHCIALTLNTKNDALNSPMRQVYW